MMRTKGGNRMDDFTIIAFTFGTMGMTFGITGFSLATQANAKLAQLESRLDKFEEVDRM